MKNRLYSFALLLPLFIAAAVTSTSVNAADEAVTHVHVCDDAIGMKLKTDSESFWVVARESDLGESSTDRMLSMALMMLSADFKVAQYATIDGPITWCGMANVQPIVDLQITK